MKSLLSRMSVRFLSYGITNFTTNRSAVKTINNYGFPLMTRFGTRCSLKTAAKTKKSDSKMDDGFFVVRKGDLVGVYNNLIDCQAQVGSSVCDPPVSVYKGYTMSKECEAYLESCGLKNALYSIRAVDLRHELFGTLVPCPFQHPHVSIDQPEKDLWSQTGHACVLEFDGACKGNPGQSGAGAVLRTPDGSLIYRLREGLGVATNNVAEYRAMILGLRYALSKGFTSIRVVGDSKLVCMQIQGLWKVRNKNIIKWYEEAKRLKDEFMFFQINHVLRDKNSEADAQANLAVVLAVGEVQEEEVEIGETESQSQ
ncbi:putative ribonuclease H [Helianthus annuus]|uniref:Ribonuclease H n=1 Tax=Helianthus annuus TaxID=4232 RepID=A0A251T273_HELAN|nr:uncharacterized protein LOC110895028 [Helianthus annuus]KAF5778117.1 putative ribonuclease H [Helianthus annuus]KAJ0493426.1 putative ribonuclease H [Helianthus annuus]KAJ0862882.1 putative ribonuclease H [Helianthus annuus]